MNVNRYNHVCLAASMVSVFLGEKFHVSCICVLVMTVTGSIVHALLVHRHMRAPLYFTPRFPYFPLSGTSDSSELHRRCYANDPAVAEAGEGGEVSFWRPNRFLDETTLKTWAYISRKEKWQRGQQGEPTNREAEATRAEARGCVVSCCCLRSKGNKCDE